MVVNLRNSRFLLNSSIKCMKAFPVVLWLSPNLFAHSYEEIKVARGIVHVLPHVSSLSLPSRLLTPMVSQNQALVNWCGLAVIGFVTSSLEIRECLDSFHNCPGVSANRVRCLIDIAYAFTVLLSLVKISLWLLVFDKSVQNNLV